MIKTYRYLRIGMIGAVVLLAASIGYERSRVDCWQTSISAYYYTPVKAIFVGSLMAVGLSLIVYKGRHTAYDHLTIGSRTFSLNLEDICLNVAGMLAPVVALAPTTDVGRCWSLAPTPLPLNGDGSLADWVVLNIDNNVNALLVAGGVGLGLAFVTLVVKRSVGAPLGEVEPGTSALLGVTFLVLIGAFVLSATWSGFDTRAHGYAAVLMFVFLIGAIIAVARAQWQEWDERGRARDRVWFRRYTAVAILMVGGALFIWLTRIFGEHTVFALEAYEITLFAVYWSLQTVERWGEIVEPLPVGAEVPVG